MALRSVTADNEHQIRLRYVCDRAGVSAITDGTKQTYCCRCLAIARAVVDIVCSDYGPGQLLHQIAFFIGALRRRDKPDRVWSILGFDLGQALSNQAERFVPTGFAKFVALSNERLRQPVSAVDMVPGEFSFDTSRDAICRTLQRLDLKNVSILRPDIEAAPDSTVSAHCLGAANARLAHRLLCF